jgi:hypothetical protein
MKDILLFILGTPEIREIIIGITLSVLFGVEQYLKKTKKVKVEQLLQIAIKESSKVICENLEKEEKRELVKKAIIKAIPNSLNITEDEIDNLVLIAYHKFVKGKNQNG